jgi:hypothetical protein
MNKEQFHRYYKKLADSDDKDGVFSEYVIVYLIFHCNHLRMLLPVLHFVYSTRMVMVQLILASLYWLMRAKSIKIWTVNWT